MIHPLMLGKGKKLFEDAPIPAAFIVTESTVTPRGVIIANYKRAGKVETVTAGAQEKIIGSVLKGSDIKKAVLIMH